VEFDSGGNTGLLYFTQLLSYRCGIKEVRYGMNGAGPDRIFDIPPCDEKDPYAVPHDAKTFLKVGKDVKSVSVQVTYSDGTQSPVREFRR
jgi:hypothetical protein